MGSAGSQPLCILTTGITMDQNMIGTVTKWSYDEMGVSGRRDNVSAIQQFVGVYKYSSLFVPKFSDKAEPRTRLTKMVEPCVWQSEPQLPFETMFVTCKAASTLRYFDLERHVAI